MNLSLKTKLILIITFVSTLAVTLTCVAVVGYGRHLVRQETIADSSTLAEVIGINSAIALASRNHALAAETLTALRAEPAIQYAAIFSTDGQVLANYIRSSQKVGFVPPSLRKDGPYFEGDSLILFQTIASESNEKIGVVCIQTDLTKEYEILRQYAVILTLVLAGSFMISLMLSSRLQKVISSPIIHLLDVESRVSREKDYSIRAQSQSHDELGMLIDGFNEMLSQIQLRDQALREKEQQYRSLSENVPIGLYRTTPDGKILHANPALLEMIGYSSMEEIAEVNLQQKNPYVGISREEFCRRLERDGRIQGFETMWLRKNGTTMHVRENAKVIRDEAGRPLFYEGTIEDISEKKRIEQLKNEFISVVSHELRVPLTSIRGTLEWISQKASDQLSPNMKKMLDIAARSSERMGRLINDMLDIEKLESGKMVLQLRQVELSSFLQQSLDAHQGLAEQYGVKFVLKESATGVIVNVDSDRMMQVMGNLLSNAAKFSPVDGTVEVSSKVVNPGIVRISVTDHGPGIPVKFRPMIFQKFAQAEGSDRRQKGGTGLGLSITKAILERLDGKIGFETEPGATTFYFDLPIFSS